MINPAAPSLIAADKLRSCRIDYNLSGQLVLLEKIHKRENLTGKAVLEIGGSNIPKTFIFDMLKARRWISVDRVYQSNRIMWPQQYEQTLVIPISDKADPVMAGDHAILDGRIESLPSSFDSRFDVVVSIDAFEHILGFPVMLERAYATLKPGGTLAAIFSPIWPSHVGHHLWGVTDKSGQTFTIESSPIPPWGHLLMSPFEMHDTLLAHTDAETAGTIVSEVFHSENLNRMFVEDYEACFRKSRFANISIASFVPEVSPPPETQAELERLHPGRTRFSTIGLFVHAEKNPDGRTRIFDE